MSCPIHETGIHEVGPKGISSDKATFVNQFRIEGIGFNAYEPTVYHRNEHAFTVEPLRMQALSVM